MVNRTKEIRKGIQRLLREEFKERETQLKTLPERIETERQRLKSIKSSADCSGGGRTGGNSRQEKDTAILVEIERLEAELRVAKKELKVFKMIMGSLSDDERFALRIMDIERQPNAIDKLCECLCLEKSRAYDVYDTALDKFGKAYYGRR